MVLTPALAACGRRLALHQGALLDNIPSVVPQSGESTAHVVIAGFGRVGRVIAQVLQQHDIPYVALDLDPSLVAAARRQGFPVFYGDASQLSVLREVRIDQARAVVLTLNQPHIAERTVVLVRRAVPGLSIVARAHDLAQQRILTSAGATAVVPETIEASLQMAGILLRDAGIASEVVEASLINHRQQHYATLGENNE